MVLFGKNGNRISVSALLIRNEEECWVISRQVINTSLRLSMVWNAPDPPPTMTVPLPTASKPTVDSLGGRDLFSLKVKAGLAVT